MLGYEIVIHYGPAELVRSMPFSKDETFLASWICACSGIDWLKLLVNKKQAVSLGGDGYPTRYVSVAEVILPLIKNGPVEYRSMLVIGEDYVLPSGWTEGGEFLFERMEACKPGDLIYIEVWDQS